MDGDLDVGRSSNFWCVSTLGSDNMGGDLLLEEVVSFVVSMLFVLFVVVLLFLLYTGCSTPLLGYYLLCQNPGFLAVVSIELSFSRPAIYWGGWWVLMVLEFLGVEWWCFLAYQERLERYYFSIFLSVWQSPQTFLICSNFFKIID